MNLEQAQQRAYSETEKEVLYLNKLMLEQYNKAQTEIIEQLEKIYGKYLTTADPQDYYNIMIQYDRLNKLLTDVQKTYSYYSAESGNYTQQLSSLSMSNVYYRQHYILEWFTPISFNFLDRQLVELSVTGTQEAWKAISKKYKDINVYVPKYGTLTELLYSNKIEDLSKLQRVITQGFIQGQSVKQLSANISDLMSNAGFKADRIARTESARTANLGNYAATQDAISQGVDIKKQWIATLDDRTRSSHAALDGQIKEQDEYFSIGGDKALLPMQFTQAKNNINCRCTIVDVVDGVSPQARGGRNPRTGEPEYFEFKTFDAWAKDHNLKKNKYGEYYGS